MAKDASNLHKHGVTFKEAATVLFDPLSATFEDEAQSAGERRFVTIGNSVRGRVLVVIHTDRANRIRLISARRATKRERMYHEEADH